jgi:MFS family permease
MVAEVVPEKRRIEAGALLYTSAPFGLALATLVNYVVAGRLLPDHPEVSWRFVFLSGLIPAAAAILVRYFVKEPERWAANQDRTPPRVPPSACPCIPRRAS